MGSRNDWSTPDHIYKPLDEIFSFSFDLAASKENAKAPLYLTEAEDALGFEWSIVNLISRARCKEGVRPNLNCWLNPPYNNIGSWMEKCLEAQSNKLTVVALLPNRTDRPWFRNIVMSNSHYFFFGDDEPEKPVNRIKFEDPTDSNRQNPGEGSILSIFYPELPRCWRKVR